MSEKRFMGPKVEPEELTAGTYLSCCHRNGEEKIYRIKQIVWKDTRPDGTPSEPHRIVLVTEYRTYRDKPLDFALGGKAYYAIGGAKPNTEQWVPYNEEEHILFIEGHPAKAVSKQYRWIEGATPAYDASYIPDLD